MHLESAEVVLHLRDTSAAAGRLPPLGWLLELLLGTSAGVAVGGGCSAPSLPPWVPCWRPGRPSAAVVAAVSAVAAEALRGRGPAASHHLRHRTLGERGGSSSSLFGRTSAGWSLQAGRMLLAHVCTCVPLAAGGCSWDVEPPSAGDSGQQQGRR